MWLDTWAWSPRRRRPSFVTSTGAIESYAPGRDTEVACGLTRPSFEHLQRSGDLRAGGCSGHQEGESVDGQARCCAEWDGMASRTRARRALSWGVLRSDVCIRGAPWGRMEGAERGLEGDEDTGVPALPRSGEASPSTAARGWSHRRKGGLVCGTGWRVDTGGRGKMGVQSLRGGSRWAVGGRERSTEPPHSAPAPHGLCAC